MQRLITSYDRFDFHTEVNAKLEQGWKVVPGTAFAGVSSAAFSHATNATSPTHVERSVIMMIVLEKP